jgi:hypothetical protein
LFLVLAGVFPQEPMSTFGHTFLVMAPAELETPFLSWRAINFVAITENVNALELYYRGAFLSLEGIYEDVYLYEKLLEYVGEASRDFRFFPIKVSDDEIEQLQHNLNTIKESSHPYNFFAYNCAHGLYNLLYQSLDNLPTPRRRVMAPLELVSILNESDRLYPPFIRRSLMCRIKEMVDEDQAELEFLEWLNRQAGTRLCVAREQRMAILRHSLSQRNVDRAVIFIPDAEWKKPHGYFRFELGAIVDNDGIYSNFKFRPILHDHTDNPHFFKSENTFELLSLSMNMSDSKIKLHQFDLFHSRSTPLHDKWFRSWSWSLYFGMTENVQNLNFGFGKSICLLNRYDLVLESLVVNSIRYDYGFGNYIGIENQIYTRANNRFRYGFASVCMFRTFDNKQHNETKLWLMCSLNEKYSLYSESIYSASPKHSVRFSLRRYF